MKKTIEQLRAEASRYAIYEAGEVLVSLEASGNLIVQRMRIERVLELAFLAGWNAGRDGVQ